jgi:predicted permease
MRLALPQGQYAGTPAVKQLWTRLLERVTAIPGVEAASLISGLAPLRPLNANDTQIEGYVKAEGGPDENIDYYQAAAPGYFEMMRIPLIEGRTFETRDGADANKVAIINQTMARAFYGNQSPLGRRIREDSDTAPWRTVVGVVRDVKNAGIDKPAGTEIYFPYSQVEGGIRGMFLLVKTVGEPGRVVSSVRAQVASLDPSLPLAQVRLMGDIIASANARPRFLSVLLSLFSLIALALAAAGIYGVMAFMVARRTQELGIRVAVGAAPSDVLHLVLGQGMRIGLTGVALGGVGAFALTRFIRQLLFGIEPFDPLTFGTTAVLLTAVVLAACYFPARRAMRVDPNAALRYD